MMQTDANIDTYDREAEFRHEADHLESVIAVIDRTISDGESRASTPLIGPDVRSADAALANRQAMFEQLRATRSKPFFGRIDFSDDTGGDVRTIYIGTSSINIQDVPDGFIMNHNAPLAALYYDPARGSYNTPRGAQRAIVYQKRTLQIENAILLDFEDVLRLSTPRILTERLSAPGTEQMTDAVQTIQPEQYEAIAATTKPVLVVQGAAGSGKSLIGLHRIDYILSPHSDIGGRERPRLDQVIMFGPSPAFLQYVSGLLPGLGVHGVRQSTVSQWLLGQFSARVTLSRNDTIFDDLMNNRRRLREAEVNAHQFKGGIKLKRLLDNYVRHITRSLRSYLRNMRQDFPLGLSATEFKRRVENSFTARSQPNTARAYLVEILAADWARNTERARRTRSIARRGETRSELITEGRRQAERALMFWPRFDFRAEYVRLISSPDKIMEFSRTGDLDLEDATEISQTAPRTEAGQALGMTDLAAALYLDYALNGFESQRFRHVVVDEAQDVSPLELELMRMHSINNSFTILGDLRQSLLRFKSIKNWSDLTRLFDRDSVSRLDSRLTYRSTRQITQYANRVLQGLPKRTETPIAYTRNGDRPKLVRSSTATDMRLSIAASVQELRQRDNVHSIAILTKWRQTANEIGGVLKTAGIPEVSVLRAGNLIETDIVVSPIILTKGLEFDAVIVANAGKNNYNETEFDRMLLYLACTRARHHLEIHWYGTRSTIVPSIERLPR